MMNILRAFLVLILGAILLGVFLAGSFFYDAYLQSPDDETEEIAIVVQQGEAVKQISKRLQDLEIIESPFWFEVYVWLSKTEGAFQVGSFNLQKGMNYKMLVASFSHAEADEVQVTIPEGYRSYEIIGVLQEELEISEEEWNRVIGSEAPAFDTFPALLSSITPGQSLEGYLFPDTYRFRVDATAEVIVETLLLTLERRLAENGIVVPEDGVMENGMTFHEVMTLASVVEKEVPSTEEMKVVADVFLKRINEGIALQACSTVNYVTRKNDPGVTYEDQQIDSPYNTYLYAGLPPGPIGNSGVNAIMAVLEPTPNTYYYFLSTEEGETLFSETYDQHVYKKSLYLD
jgi:UPF0755 protein